MFFFLNRKGISGYFSDLQLFEVCCCESHLNASLHLSISPQEILEPSFIPWSPLTSVTNEVMLKWIKSWLTFWDMSRVSFFVTKSDRLSHRDMSYCFEDRQGYFLTLSTSVTRYTFLWLHTVCILLSKTFLNSLWLPRGALFLSQDILLQLRPGGGGEVKTDVSLMSLWSIFFCQGLLLAWLSLPLQDKILWTVLSPDPTFFYFYFSFPFLTYSLHLLLLCTLFICFLWDLVVHLSFSLLVDSFTSCDALLSSSSSWIDRKRDSWGHFVHLPWKMIKGYNFCLSCLACHLTAFSMLSWVALIISPSDRKLM